MEKKDGGQRNLLRPTAAIKSKSTSTSAAAEPVDNTDSNKSENGSSLLTEDFMKKISTNVMSPLTANRPGRLASLRPERDLTLGASSVKTNNLLSGASIAAASATGAKAKKIFAPTIPTRRGKNQDSQDKDEDKFPFDTVSSRGRGKDSGRGRGRGRGRPELIQVK